MSDLAVGGSGGSGAARTGAATGVLVAGALVFALSGEHGAQGVSDRGGLVSMAVALPALGLTAVSAVTEVAALGAWPGAHEDGTAAVASPAREVRSVGEPLWTHSLGGGPTAIDVTFAFRPCAHAGLPSHRGFREWLVRHPRPVREG
jgi:hypothetical protein